jgi:opacity protein-like surface antigen
MRTRMRFLIITGAALLLVIAAALAKNVDSKEPADAGAWEYLVVAGGTVNLQSMSSEEFAGMRKQPDGSFKEATVLERNLDKLGAKGWQLVTVYGSPNNPIYYFKRPKEVK